MDLNGSVWYGRGGARQHVEMDWQRATIRKRGCGSAWWQRTKIYLVMELPGGIKSGYTRCSDSME